MRLIWSQDLTISSKVKNSPSLRQSRLYLGASEAATPEASVKLDDLLSVIKFEIVAKKALERNEFTSLRFPQNPKTTLLCSGLLYFLRNFGSLQLY